jgi:hypothetical protein
MCGAARAGKRAMNYAMVGTPSVWPAKPGTFAAEPVFQALETKARQIRGEVLGPPRAIAQRMQRVPATAPAAPRSTGCRGTFALPTVRDHRA